MTENPPVLAKPPVRRTPLDRWFAPVKVPREASEELSALAARGTLVFVMRSSGVLNFIYLRWLLRRLRLPAIRAAAGFRGLFGWLARVRRTQRALEDAIAAGDSVLVFLGRRGATDPFTTLVALQRDLFQPIFLVPSLLVWSRRPQKLKPSLFDILFGSPEAPSAFATAIAFLRNYKRAFLQVGRPLDLASFVKERPAEPDVLLARKVRGALHYHLAREMRTAVGPPLKAPSRVREKVLRDRSLRDVLEHVSRTRGRSLAAVTEEAERDLREIASRYSPAFIEMMRPVMRWLFGRLYDRVEIDEVGLARVKRAAAEVPIVLCPSHKSHIDYLILSYVFYEAGMTPPHVAAGINLAFWPFGTIARHGGGFFIRRSFKGDKVYTATLRAYVKHLLRDRFPQEFYIEGGRSRTGKLLFPKTGLLSMEVDAWLDGASDDVLFVPIAIDYERLVEARSYAKELSGGEKTKESFGALLRARKVLRRRYGRLYVQFEEPVSCRELAQKRLGTAAASLTLGEGDESAGARSSGPANTGTAEPAQAKRQLVQHLANHIAYCISRAITLTPVGLVSAALLSHLQRGIGADEVARRVELLRTIAATDGARFAPGLAGAPSDPRAPGPIADALAALAAEGMIRVERAAGETIYQVVDERRPLLDFHRNNVIHRYVGPSLVASALRASGCDAPVAEVRERAHRLSRLLKLEFMYPVGATFDALCAENVGGLSRLGAIEESGGRVRAGRERWILGFLADLTRAYLEAYRLVAETLLALGDGEARGGVRGLPPSLDRRSLVRESLERGRAAFLSGRVALREALSRETIENAVEWFVQQRAVVSDGHGKLTLDRLGGAEMVVSLVREIDLHLSV